MSLVNLVMLLSQGNLQGVHLGMDLTHNRPKILLHQEKEFFDLKAKKNHENYAAGMKSINACEAWGPVAKINAIVTVLIVI